MAILNFTLSEEGVTALRDALICLSKFSDDVSLEARKDSFTLTTLNVTKSAYASFKFGPGKFFSRYSFQGTGPYREKFYCTLFIRSLISIFRSRTSVDTQRDVERHTVIEKCDVAVEDGEGISSRFIARIVFRNGLTSTHRLPFEVAVPVHAKFNKSDSPHHWVIASRTLRQLMDHFGPGIDLLDINTDGDHVNFTCFSEKTVSEDAVLKKPLQTSIAVEADEFDDIDVEDKLHIVISVKDFRAIIQHAGITGNVISARYSLPARPIQFSYGSEAISCEFLVMTVAPSEAPGQDAQQMPPPPPASRRPPNLTPQMSAPRASASRLGAFDLRPTQQAPPPATHNSESLFVDEESWEPMRDEEEEEDNARLEWDHSAETNPAELRMKSMMHQTAQPAPDANTEDAASANLESQALEPTQNMSEVQNLALFPD
ncbi:DNA repair Rad9 [Emericellopsis cladophorae]|uniref:DNA repair protein rad9 n=1 Tax=Emericellopsis cladophorae TaxID=2686198 RepID=A0A9P9Y849_9HYPO|nr:DNA repair Rad9 [Emericellopsis cladophorae]KAI6784740.1 DNA repair Rad9 [Emericellopsis cladophorae]